MPVYCIVVLPVSYGSEHYKLASPDFRSKRVARRHRHASTNWLQHSNSWNVRERLLGQIVLVPRELRRPPAACP